MDIIYTMGGPLKRDHIVIPLLPPLPLSPFSPLGRFVRSRELGWDSHPSFLEVPLRLGCGCIGQVTGPNRTNCGRGGGGVTSGGRGKSSKEEQIRPSVALALTGIGIQ